MRESDSCCGRNCDGFCQCVTAGVKTDFAKQVSEIILMFIGSAVIELGVEFGWNETSDEVIQAWMKESIVSSGASATYAVLISTFLRIMNHRHGYLIDNDENQIDNNAYFYTSTIISQVLSGAISFGVGMLFDFTLHEVIDDFEKSSNLGLSIMAPIVMVSAQIVARIGIFKAVGALRKACQQEKEYELLDKSTTDTALIKKL